MASPAVGAAELRILSPTLLELQLVTTKDPDPAPVTIWNFVGENFALTLPPVSQFQVLANGSPVPVAQVGFRRRPVYAPLKIRDLRIGNSLFLQLSAPIADGQTVVVKNPGGNLWAATVNFSGLMDPARANSAIHVNQVGYVPNLPKKAMVGYYLGSLGEMPVPSLTFNLLEANSLAIRFTGTLTLRRDFGYTYGPTPYQNVYEADFSSFTAPGEYLLQVPGMGVSDRFQVHAGTAAVFARALALGLYHQRCGGSNLQPFTRHEHGICHALPAEVPTIAFTAVNATLANMSSDYANNPLHTAPQLKDVDSSLYPFINRGPIDVSGGHHDAGDYSKYTINSAGLIHHLVFAADAFPGVAALDNLGIPESGDGRSDLLQEAKWEADFLAKMQDADGGFYFLVYPRNREYEDNVLPDFGDSQVVFPKTTAVTAAAVAALAESASSPTFKAQFPVEAAAYLARARNGWSFLSAAISKYGKNGAYQKITHYGNEFMHDDELAWAAAALFVATGDPIYHNQLKSWFDPSDPNTRRWTWWRLFEGYGCAVRTYAFAARSGRLPATSLDPAYLAKCEAEIVATGDDIARFARESAYGTSFPDLNKSYRSAGWYFSSERAFELVTAGQLAPSSAYTEALISNMNYEGGCNPINMPYVTGLGWRAWRDIVHQYAQNDYQVLPPAGIPLGNVQAGFAYLENYKQSLGQLCYPPDGAATAPYPFYDRWGDSFNTTTEFVVVDMSRSLATYASLMAGTAYASLPYTRGTASIGGLPATVPAEQSITATFSAPGIDLTGARITWEARDQDPFIGSTFSFAAKNSGAQWIEAEALLPDGRRIVCKSNFMASYSLAMPPNSFQSAPLNLTSDLVALYHADASLTDSSGRNPSLALAGNARLDGLNLGWMANRAGSALRFDDLGDNATVTIPASLLYSSSTTELSIEAMIFVESYKGWNRGAARLLSMEHNWDSSLKWFEDTYSGPHVSGGTTFDCTGAALAAALPTGKWHHLQISVSSTAYALRVNGALIATVSAADLPKWSGGSVAVELGNFSGWMDEIAIRSKAPPDSGTGVAPSLPEAPSNFQAVALSSSQIALSWTDRANNEQGYRIYRSSNGGKFSLYATIQSNLTSQVVSRLAMNTVYTFSLRAFNAVGESPEVLASARTLIPPPPIPTGLKAAVQNRSVLVSWKASNGAVGYNVKHSLSKGGPYVLIGANVPATSYTDATVTPGVTNYYAVSACGINMESRDSSPVSALVPLLTADARLLAVNSQRKGSWVGQLGTDGFYIATDAQEIPSYASVTLSGKDDWIWEYFTDDTRALQRPPATSRLASCWYSPTAFEFNVSFADRSPHKMSLYLLDWDGAQRSEQIDVIDAITGQVLHSYTASSAGEGVYLEYQLIGNVNIRCTRIAGPNAVVSGIFFDPVN